MIWRFEWPWQPGHKPNFESYLALGRSGPSTAPHPAGTSAYCVPRIGRYLERSHRSEDAALCRLSGVPCLLRVILLILQRPTWHLVGKEKI